MGLKVKVVGQRSRSNMKIMFFSLLPEKEVKVRGHKGQGQGHEVKVKGRRSGSKVIGQGQMSQRSRSKVVGQGQKVKVKVVRGIFSPHRLAGGSTRGRFHNLYKEMLQVLMH